MAEEEVNEEEVIMDIVHYLEENSEHFCYIDEYKIFVTPHSTEPVIVMSLEEFMRAEKKALGYGES